MIKESGYDGFNQLVSYAEGSAAVTYSYGAKELRQYKTTGGVSTTHIGEGQNIVLDVIGANIIKYIRGTNLIAQGTSSNNTYYLFNAHGDVVHLTNSAGALVKNYVFDAFGVEANIDANDSDPFRYCGEYFDDESGYIYLSGRYYDSTNERFISEDPVYDYVSWYIYTA